MLLLLLLLFFFPCQCLPNFGMTFKMDRLELVTNILNKGGGEKRKLMEVYFKFLFDSNSPIGELDDRGGGGKCISSFC